MRNKALSIAALVLSVGLALSLADLYKVQQGTLVVYTTPALQGLLESLIAPRFQSETGIGVTPVYVSAGEQYNRLQVSGGHPEADVFLHASPLFIEKGYAAGYFQPFEISRNASVPASFASRNVTGGHLWYGFAWSPLAEVYGPSLPQLPDLNFINTTFTFGFPHPLLSNNGIYAVLFFEHDSASAQAGARALAHTVVQPTNARANILGVADGAFDATLGYEGVTLFYLNQGARGVSIPYLPLLYGQRFVTPVVFSVGLVNGHPNPRALDFINFLFRDEVQSNISRYYFRSVFPGLPAPSGGIALPSPGAVTLNYDWSQWQTLELALSKYVIGG